MIKAKLVMVGDQQKPTVIKVKKLPMTIGRGKEADLTLAHPMVSRLHCELYEVEGTLCIRDMGSLNGSFVGDVRVTEAALESGDLMTIGTATFKLVIGDDSAGEDEIMPPPPAASTANEEATTMGDVDDDSFIEVDDAPAEPKKQEPKKKESQKSPDKTKPKEAATAEPQQDEPNKEKKKKVKKKASAKTLGFDPDAISAADEGKDADDDDLSDFLANLS